MSEKITKKYVEDWYANGIEDGSILKIIKISDTHTQISGRGIFGVIPTKLWNDALLEASKKILNNIK